jgi:hypothetical protein
MPKVDVWLKLHACMVATIPKFTKDNWNMQEEIQLVVQAIQDRQINKWHFKVGKAWMQVL